MTLEMLPWGLESLPSTKLDMLVGPSHLLADSQPVCCVPVL